MTAKTKTKEKSKKHSFSAEVGKVLQLVIHSLYTNKDIFLRELISNASDACDKLRYEAVTTPELLSTDPELKISITYDANAKTLNITDNGIGMNEKELVQNLGTIAKSGTQGFLQNLSGDSKKDMQLIGQFGVGFYSAFMVAEKIMVISSRAGEAQGHIWQSDGQGSFTIEALEGTATRGTSITLFMKEEATEYLDKHRLQHIIRTYSDHIGFPITVTETGGEAIVANKASALWTRQKSDITPEQYQEFYRHIAHQADEPWLIMHNKSEGTVEYTNLLFIPSTKPFDLFHPDRMTRLKLYVKRVFITDQDIDIIPRHLRFIRGVVDSEDLPLNISRETLQHNVVLAKIRQSLVNRIYSELKKKAEKEPESYLKFWEQFGAVIKEGLCDISESRDKLLEICRFRTALGGNKFVSLDEYVANMKPEQKEIFYLTGSSIDMMLQNPQLEGFIERGIDVILLGDSVDDFWVNVISDYKEKHLRSITRAGVDLSDIPTLEKPEEETPKKDSAKLLSFFKETLGNKVKDVRATTKLHHTPACLAADEHGMDLRFERFMFEQKQLPARGGKILEVNLTHPAIQRVEEQLGSDEAKDIALLIFDQACILEGEELSDPAGFAKRFNALLTKIA